MLNESVEWLTSLIGADRWFSIGLELVSLALLAPLTARFVYWQADKKWRMARFMFINELCDLLVKLDEASGRALFSISNFEQVNELFDDLQSADFSQDVNEYLVPGFLIPAEIHLGENHQSFILPSDYVYLEGLDEAALKNVLKLCNEISDLVPTYGFCLSPQMINILSIFMSNQPQWSISGELSSLRANRERQAYTRGFSGQLFFSRFRDLHDGVQDFLMRKHSRSRWDGEARKSGKWVYNTLWRAMLGIDFHVASRDIERLISTISLRKEERELMRLKISILSRSRNVVRLAKSLRVHFIIVEEGSATGEPFSPYE
ncbi:hypothetical protein ACFQDZ_02405 [Sulfitobacter pacificus]